MTYRNKAGQHRFAGFSLIEVMIGILIFGACCVALYAALAGGAAGMRFAREDLQATQLMVDKLEAMRLYRWEQLNDPQMVPSTFQFDYSSGKEVDGTQGKNLRGIIYRGEVIITNVPLAANYSSQLKQITVKIDWQSGGVQRHREISTMVAKNGLYTFVQ